MPYIREDQAEITVRVMNPQGQYESFFESWYSAEGAGLETDSSKTRAGGMGDEVALGGQTSRGDVTVSIQLSDLVLNKHSVLEQRVIEDAPVEIGFVFLDRLKQPYSTTQTVHGVLTAATLPDVTQGSHDAAMYQITASLDERAHTG